MNLTRVGGRLSELFDIEVAAARHFQYDGLPALQQIDGCGQLFHCSSRDDYRTVPVCVHDVVVTDTHAEYIHR